MYNERPSPDVVRAFYDKCIICDSIFIVISVC